MSVNTAVIGKWEHYMDSTGTTAVIGAVRHRASRRVLRARGVGRGLLLLVSKKHREEAMRVRIANSNTETIEIPRPTPSPALQNQVAQAMKAITGSLPPAPEPPKRGLLERVRDKLYDQDWHHAARQTAGTVLMWSFTGTSVLVFGKAVLWILSL